MKFGSLAGVAVLLMTWFAALVLTPLAFVAGAGWALGWLGVIWGAFLLALTMRWTPLRDLAWSAGVGYAIGVMRWLDVPAEAGAALRWTVIGADVLCLLFFVLIAPALLSRIAAMWMPKAPEPEPALPVEQPARPERLRRWGP